MPSLLGRKFGRLTAVALDGMRGKNSYWRCVCECGAEKVICAANLSSGRQNSCGCLQKETKCLPLTHGHSVNGKESRTYKSWTGIKDRCLNPRNRNYPGYGGRGIRVCDRWQSFAAFLEDMGPRPDGFSIDRIDSNGHYSPENCRWATRREQMNNVRYNRVLTVHGERMTQAEAARRFGVDQKLINSRIKLGWGEERAATQPPRSHHWRANGK